MDDPFELIIASLLDRLTPDFAEAEVRALLRQGQDVGGGINAFRLIRHWLGAQAGDDATVRRAYEQIRPTLSRALEQVPSLYYFQGD
jgi:hypothetical protein